MNQGGIIPLSAATLSTATGKALPRCTACGERTKQHDPELCVDVGAFKEDLKAKLKAKREKAQSVKTEYNHCSMEYAHGSSASQANKRGHTAAFSPSPDPAPFASFTSTSKKSTAQEASNKDKGIYIPVSSRPNLTTRYQPVLDMRFLLELRGLQLGNFHITQGGNWAFTVTGSRTQMLDWAMETKACTAARGASMSPKQSRFQAVLLLILGSAMGMLAIFAIAIQPM